MSYLYYLFRNSSALEIITRELVEGIHAETIIRGSCKFNRAEQIGNTGSSPCGKNRKDITDEGLAKIADILSKPVEINLTFTSDDRDDDNLRA